MSHIPMTKATQIRRRIERGEGPQSVAALFGIPTERVIAISGYTKEKIMEFMKKAKEQAAEMAAMSEYSEFEQLEAEIQQQKALEEEPAPKKKRASRKKVQPAEPATSVAASDENWEE